MYLGSLPTVTRGRLSPGRKGVAETLAMMRKLVHEGSRDLAVRDAAVRIVRTAGVAGHDFAGEVRALFEYVRDRVRFVRDPAGVEQLQGARWTLEHGYGDCDDKTTLLASLLLAVGHRTRLALRAVGFAPGQLSHVHLMAQVGGRWLALDPTRSGTPLGWVPPGVVNELRAFV